MRIFVVADLGTQLLDAFGNAIRVLFAFIPALIGALIILLIGWIIANVVKAVIVRLLRAIRFDQIMTRAGITGLLERGGVRADAASVVAGIVYWFIFLIFVVAAANALGVATITTIVTSIVLFLPNVLVALIILIIGALVSRFVADLVRSSLAAAGVGGANVLASIVRFAILAFVGIMALNQLGVGAVIVQTLFASVTFGLALALALAFGLGGRDTAKNIVDSWYTSMSNRNPSGRPLNPPPPPTTIR